MTASRVRRGLTTVVALVGVAPLAVAVAAASGRSPAVATITVGSQTLTRCASAPPAYCGTLAVPLDRGVTESPSIAISFRWYPATAPPGGVAAGTVVPVEGGPGFPSIGSVRGGYQVMYGSLLEDWNMLAVDLRGTGASTPLDCPALQEFTGRDSGPAFDAAVGGCDGRLDRRWKTTTGRPVEASDLFTSAAAAADVAAVIEALDIPPVGLYGDSYGSFFAQVFARRYPQLVRSVVLDSTYATEGLDPWYRSTIDAMPAAFDAVCRRSAACAAAPG